MSSKYEINKANEEKLAGLEKKNKKLSEELHIIIPQIKAIEEKISSAEKEHEESVYARLVQRIHDERLLGKTTDNALLSDKDEELSRINKTFEDRVASLREEIRLIKEDESAHGYATLKKKISDNQNKISKLKGVIDNYYKEILRDIEREERLSSYSSANSYNSYADTSDYGSSHSNYSLSSDPLDTILAKDRDEGFGYGEKTTRESERLQKDAQKQRESELQREKWESKQRSWDEIRERKNEGSKTFVFFKNGSVVLLLHHTNNMYAAKKAMLKTYGKSESDIVTTGSGCVGRSYTTFDGRDCH